MTVSRKVAERAVTVGAVRADRAESSQTRATAVRFEPCCAPCRVGDLGRGQQTRDRLGSGMMNTLPNAPLSVGTSKTWHCARMSTGLSTVSKPDLVVPGHLPMRRCTGSSRADQSLIDRTPLQRPFAIPDRPASPQSLH